MHPMIFVLLALHLIRIVQCNIGILYLQVQKIKGIKILKFNQYHSAKIQRSSLDTINQIARTRQSNKSISESMPRIRMEFHDYDMNTMIKVNLPLPDSNTHVERAELFLHIVPIYANRKHPHLSNQTFCIALSSQKYEHDEQDKNMAECLHCNRLEGKLQALSTFTLQNMVNDCLELNKYKNTRLIQFIGKLYKTQKNENKTNFFGYFLSAIFKLSFIFVAVAVLAIKYRRDNQNQIQPI